MTYDPSIDAPRNLEEWNECVDYYYNIEQQKYQQEIAEARAAVQADYTALPDEERSKITLEAFLEKSLITVFPAPSRADVEKTYAVYYPRETIITPENEQTQEGLFAKLRSFREVKLQDYDTKISQLERRARFGEDVASEIAAWDAYALALCNLPEQEGAPWDGGGILTPWPKAPV